MNMIRPARVEDEQVVSELIALSFRAFGDALFGLGDPLLHRKVIAAMVRGTNTRFSHRLVDLAEVDGIPAGLLLSMPGRDLAGLELPMVGYLLRLYGLGGTLRFLALALRVAGATEATRSEYYVSNLAVFPAYRGQGLGRLLLERAEQKARLAGLNTCSLTVEMDNHQARSLYERVGYRVVKTHPTPHLQKTLGTIGQYHMVKALGSS
jgi:ribosomal protein S18 acetylase RimI-like enzyme